VYAQKSTDEEFPQHPNHPGKPHFNSFHEEQPLLSTQSSPFIPPPNPSLKSEPADATPPSAYTAIHAVEEFFIHQVR
jgi:hypothetical protein